VTQIVNHLAFKYTMHTQLNFMSRPLIQVIYCASQWC